MALTVSIHGGSTLSLAHNRRTILNEPHIDYSRSHLNVVLERHQRHDFYKEIFGDAIEEYNKKQTRSDRGIKIHNAKGEIEGSKIVTWCRATNAKEREFIIAFGSSNDGYSYDLKKEMLLEYFKGFKARNPKLKIMDAVIHCDEVDEENPEVVWQPHLHIVVIPVVESARGVRLKMSMDAALAGQQGAVYDRKTKKRYSPFFQKWRADELEVAKKVLKDRNIPFKDGDKRSEHYSTKEYKEYKEELWELQKKVKELELLQGDLDDNIKLNKGVAKKCFDEAQQVHQELELLTQYTPVAGKVVEVVRQLQRKHGEIIVEAAEDLIDKFRQLNEDGVNPWDIFMELSARVRYWFEQHKLRKEIKKGGQNDA